ncbi:MAG: branched-chain amino acid ABC transporter permease [Deltaproteobacteria bacterium]|nr:branched-chain amino acid ABC transporter permease [Deltaproteobacteria bacterium]
MLFLQLLANGIIAGSVYALLGLGFGVIYSATRTFHFAHGAVYSMAGYLAFQFHVFWHLPLAVSIALSLLAAILLGIGIEGLIYRPLRGVGASPMEILLSSLGLFILLQNFMIILWRSDPRVLPVAESIRKGVALWGIWVTSLQLIIIAISFGLWGLLLIFSQRTKMGKAIRALESDPEMTEIVGIDPVYIRFLVYGMGSALAAVSSILMTMDMGIDPNSGIMALLIAVIAVIVGGIGNYSGTALAGLLLGIAENMGIWKIPSEWKSTIAFGILVIFIIFRPTGLLKKT